VGREWRVVCFGFAKNKVDLCKLLFDKKTPKNVFFWL
jgi:hypothetical protein